MDPFDSELDPRLRAASKPPPDAVERVIARAMSSSRSRHDTRRRLMAAAVTVGLLVAALGFRYWPRHTAERPLPTQARVGVVLIRAPDGTSAIYSTGADTDTVPPGSGFVIAEGDQR